MSNKVTIEISREAAEAFSLAQLIEDKPDSFLVTRNKHATEVTNACKAALSKDKRYRVAIYEIGSEWKPGSDVSFELTREQLERQSKKPIYDECVEGLPAEFLTYACRKVLENEAPVYTEGK